MAENQEEEFLCQTQAGVFNLDEAANSWNRLDGAGSNVYLTFLRSHNMHRVVGLDAQSGAGTINTHLFPSMEYRKLSDVWHAWTDASGTTWGLSFADAATGDEFCTKIQEVIERITNVEPTPGTESSLQKSDSSASQEKTSRDESPPDESSTTRDESPPATGKTETVEMSKEGEKEESGDVTSILDELEQMTKDAHDEKSSRDKAAFASHRRLTASAKLFGGLEKISKMTGRNRESIEKVQMQNTKSQGYRTGYSTMSKQQRTIDLEIAVENPTKGQADLFGPGGLQPAAELGNAPTTRPFYYIKELIISLRALTSVMDGLTPYDFSLYFYPRKGGAKVDLADTATIDSMRVKTGSMLYVRLKPGVNINLEQATPTTEMPVAEPATPEDPPTESSVGQNPSVLSEGSPMQGSLEMNEAAIPSGEPSTSPAKSAADRPVPAFRRAKTETALVAKQEDNAEEEDGPRIARVKVMPDGSLPTRFALAVKNADGLSKKFKVTTADSWLELKCRCLVVLANPQADATQYYLEDDSGCILDDSDLIQEGETTFVSLVSVA